MFILSLNSIATQVWSSIFYSCLDCLC